MKHILKFVWANLMYLLVFLITFLIGVWTFDWRQFKEAGKDYRMMVASFTWKIFKKNIY